MLRVKCSRCGFVFYEGEVMCVDNVLRKYLSGNNPTPRCPKCMKELEVQRIVLIPKRRKTKKLVIDILR